MALNSGCYKSLYGPSNHVVICLLYRKSKHFFSSNNFFPTKTFLNQIFFNKIFFYWPLTTINPIQAGIFSDKICFSTKFFLIGHQLFNGLFNLWPANGAVCLDNISLSYNKSLYGPCYHVIICKYNNLICYNNKLQ